MITLITGAPGAGKTAALVSMLEGLGKDRPLFVHGIPDLTIPHVALDDPATWPETVPDGAVVIIDEVQTVWRPAGAGQKLPDHIAKLETHRHRGLDFYIITQGPNLVHSNVRALVGRHVHLRDIGVLGRWWYEWPETADNCRTGWKAAPIKKRYRLPKAVFGSYKSASLHVKPERSFPVVLAVLAVAVLGVAYLAWSSYGKITEKMAGGNLPAAVTGTTSGQILNPLSTGLGGRTAEPIDDRTAWMPRVSDRPESAPAFDAIRVVVNMPIVSGGACFRGSCKCYTQQGTDAGLSDHLCKRWIENRPFDAYTLPKKEVTAYDDRGGDRRRSRVDQNDAAPSQVVTVPMPSGFSNPRADALEPSPFPPGAPFHPTPARDAAGIIPPTLQSPYRRS